MELDPNYVDVIVNRWQVRTGSKALLEGEDRTFDDLKLAREAQVEGCRLMQSRWLSLVETVTNIVSGYCLAVPTQIIVFPLLGPHASVGEKFLLAALFTGVSLSRSLEVRRLFNEA